MSNIRYLTKYLFLKSINENLNSPTTVIFNSFPEDQKKQWPLLRDNLSALESAYVREDIFKNIGIKFLHIPHRIKSTTASVDKKTIESRDCFLCEKNLPGEQRGILFLDKYVLLCNPYPIFEKHFTLAGLNHEPQQIQNHLNNMISLAREFGDEYLLFYNGPNCGASAPDHFHFQVCRQSDLPVVKRIHSSLYNFFQLPSQNKGTTTYLDDTFPAPYIVLKSDNEDSLFSEFNSWYNRLKKYFTEDNEPKINLLAFYHEGNYHLVIFPRMKHRPECYFKEGNESLLISPAAIDLSGIVVVPRHEDFIRLSESDLIKIYNEVTISADKLKQLA